MKIRDKQRKLKGEPAPQLPPQLSDPYPAQDPHAHHLLPKRSPWQTPLLAMSNDISVHTLNAHRNWGLVQTILGEHLHHIYLFQEAAYTKQLRRTQTLDPRLPLGVWQDGYPRERGFLDFMHTNKRVCAYIDNKLNFLYAYEEIAGDIQIIHTRHKENNTHAFSMVNVYIDHNKTTIPDINVALCKCKHPIYMAGDFNTPSNHWDD